MTRTSFTVDCHNHCMPQSMYAKETFKVMTLVLEKINGPIKYPVTFVRCNVTLFAHLLLYRELCK